MRSHDLSELRSHRLLRDIPGPDLDRLVRLCEAVSLVPGDVLSTPGQENHTLYLVLRGELRVHMGEKDSPERILIKGGEIIGEMSIIERRLVSAWVVADQESTLLAMPERVFWEQLCPLPGTMPILLELVVARMRSTGAMLQGELVRKVRYEMLSRELASAGKIQANILPSGNPLFKNPFVDAHALIKPAREVGGDFFDAIAVDDRRVCIAIGDVSGKGMPAALFMVRAITLLRLSLLREKDPRRVLPELNRQLCEANDELMFVTMAVVLIDTETGRFTYLNAGHNPPLIASRGQQFGYWHPPKGALLGVEPKANFDIGEGTLLPGHTIVLYTDGVTEAENTARELFGADRAARALSGLQSREKAADLVAGLDDAVSAFVNGAPQSDDITLLAIIYRGGLAGIS